MLWNVKHLFCFSFCKLDVNQHWIFHFAIIFGKIVPDWLLRLSKIHPAKFCRGMQSRGFSVDSHPPNGYCVDGQFIWLIMLSWSSQNDTSLYAKHNLFRQKAGYPQGQDDFKGSFSISFQTFILVSVGSTSSHCQLEPLICGFQRYLNDNWDDFKPL